MLDNDLFALIRTIINANATVAGIPGLTVKQSFQPTQQGVDTNPASYLFKIGDHRLGFPQRKDVWDAMTSQMIHTTLQQYETTFQISALATQNPSTPAAYTASDILNAVAYILQSDAAVDAFEAAGVGILRVADVRNPYFSDDRQRNEADPSFDFTLTHKQVIVTETPILQTEEVQIYSV